MNDWQINLRIDDDAASRPKIFSFGSFFLSPSLSFGLMTQLQLPSIANFWSHFHLQWNEKRNTKRIFPLTCCRIIPGCIDNSWLYKCFYISNKYTNNLRHFAWRLKNLKKWKIWVIFKNATDEMIYYDRCPGIDWQFRTKKKRMICQQQIYIARIRWPRMWKITTNTNEAAMRKKNWSDVFALLISHTHRNQRDSLRATT